MKTTSYVRSVVADPHDPKLKVEGHDFIKARDYPGISFTVIMSRLGGYNPPPRKTSSFRGCRVGVKF